MAQPVRSCVSCRRRRPQAELVRIVRAEEGRPVADVRGVAPGRGAYVCRSRDCVVEVTREGRLERALRAPLGAGDLATLRREIEGVIG